MNYAASTAGAARYSRRLTLLGTLALAIGLLMPSPRAHAQSSTLEGTLEVQVEDYADHTSKTRHYLNTVGGQRHELKYSGETPQNLVSGAKIRARGRLANNVLALDSGSTSLQTVAAAPAYSLGIQKTLVLLVNFQDNTSQPYTLAGAQSLMSSVDAFMRENSFQQTTISTSVYGWFTLATSSVTCSQYDIKTMGLAAATAAGVNISDYNRFVYVFPRSSGCSWAGMAVVGGSPTDAWINGAMDLKTVAHEMGHNLGASHAHSQNCDQSPIGLTCSGYEYGDLEDTMGNGRGDYNAFTKEVLGWLNASGMPPITTVQASGSYTLEPYSTASSGGAKGLKVLRSTDPTTGEKTYYYLEFRQPQGFDSVLSGQGNLVSGVTIRSASASRGSFELDMTPNSNTVAPAYDTMDGALAVGSSFTDSTAGVTITVTWANSTGAGVDVTLGSQTTCKRAAPSLLLSSSSQSVAAGTTLSYTVAVTNNDSSACGTGSFSLARTLPSGWSGTLAAASLSIAPGSVASTTLTVTSPTTATAGTYSLGATATNSASTSLTGSGSSTYTVASSSGSTTTLSGTLSTDKSSYVLGDTVISSASVSAGGTPVAGASVSFTLTKANGNKVTGSATTASNGIATFQYKLRKNDPTGAYQVASVASSSGKTANNAASFTTTK